MAVCPRATVWLAEPETANVKSRLIPDSGTNAPVASALLVTVRVPVCAPATVGANSTAAVQLCPGSSALGHVLLSSWNPGVTASARLLRLADAPVLLTVTVVWLLVSPGAVVAKTIAVGDNWIAAPAAPVPLSKTVAGVATDTEPMVNTPVAGPTAAG